MHARGYTALVKLGKSPISTAAPTEDEAPRMPRIIVVIIALVLVVGGLVLLSTQAREVPVTTIETDVSQGRDAR
jgi:hypothetical protein